MWMQLVMERRESLATSRFSDMFLVVHGTKRADKVVVLGYGAILSCLCV